MRPPPLARVVSIASLLSFAALATRGGVVSAKPGAAARRAADDGEGGEFCSDVMCVRGSITGSSIQYMLRSTGSKPTGWMAVGFGSYMANSPMIIMWPNDDGSFTLSQRKAPFETEPKLDTNPPFTATFLPDQSLVREEQVTMTFSLPFNRTMEDSHERQIIWAFGATRPDPAVDATLKFHYRSGSTKLTLSHDNPAAKTGSVPAPEPTSEAQVAPASTPSSDKYAAAPQSTKVDDQLIEGDASGQDSRPLASYQNTILIHAVLSFLGFLVILPTGSLLARFLRTHLSAWTAVHWIVQFVAAGLTIVFGLYAAYRAVDQAGMDHFDDAHKRWGVLLVVLYAVQCAGGALTHRFFPAGALTGRLHTALGLSAIALAFFQTRQGYAVEWVAATGMEAPWAFGAAWWTLLIAVPLLYVAGMLLQKQGAITLGPRDKDRDPENEYVPLYTVADDHEDVDEDPEMHVPKLERPE